MPQPIGIRGRTYERYSIRGRVTDRREGQPGAEASAGVVVLEDHRGRTQALAVEPWTGALGVGQEVTAVWLVRPDQGSGPYVAVRDHATGEVRYNDRALARLARPGWVLLAGLLGGVLLRFSATGVGLALLGCAAWWFAGIQGRRHLKASGALLGMRTDAAGKTGSGAGHLHRP